MNGSPVAPTLETERLLLRAHKISDFDDSASMWADQNVVAQISGAPLTKEQSWSRLLRYSGHWNLLGFGYWVVVLKANGSFLGEVGFADYHRDTEPSLEGKPEAGWVFNVPSHGKGYATEAAKGMLTWADENLPNEHTSAIFNPTHLASINVAKKVGFSNAISGRYGSDDILIMERSKS
jgi:RimJ/RimL family protein N-acetyltransferase